MGLRFKALVGSTLRPLSGSFVLLLLASLGSGSGGCFSPDPSDAGGTPPRTIVLISIDTLRADHLGVYGHPRFTSPILDAFAAEGVVFDDASATTAWTLPSHASMLTGLFPRSHGVMTVVLEGRGFPGLSRDRGGAGDPTGPFGGAPATGKSVEFTDVTFVRIENGKVAELWGLSDHLTLHTQLGAMEPPAG